MLDFTLLILNSVTTGDKTMKRLTAKQVWVISWMAAIATAGKKSATTVSGGTVAKAKTTTEGPSIYCTDGGYTFATREEWLEWKHS